jgi:hypothetical protein
MPPLRLTFVRLAAAAASLLLLSSPASAQLSVSGSCLSGGPGCSLFEFVLEAPDRPVALESAEFTFLSPGWGFVVPGFFDGEDQFGPFSGVADVAGGSTLSILFPDSPGFPVEFVAPFPGRIRTEVIGAGNEASFAWTATEIDGNTLAGTFGEAVAAPEPGTFLLLAAGLFGIVAVRRREAMP